MSTTTCAVVEYIDEYGMVNLNKDDDDDCKFSLPFEFLPKNIKEGDYLRLVITTDPEARRLAQKDEFEVGGVQKQVIKNIIKRTQKLSY
jgi:hypothetical protein